MYFKQIVREDLGCAAYILGSTGAGECAIVDPRIDEVDEILALVGEKGMRVRAIVETHNHADHVAGHEELTHRTGAPIYIHGAAHVAYPHTTVHDGDTLTVGEVVLRFIHTPGHRPEHIAVAVADTSRSDETWLVLTGDSLFIGDVARPDLAVDGAEGAAELYQSLYEKLLALPDSVEVYPGHVSGSLCGRAMNLKPSSTIGFERRHNPALHAGSRDDFVEAMNQNLPQRPPNMENIVEVNRAGGATTGIAPALIPPREFEQMAHASAPSTARPLVLDVRSPAEFGAGHVAGALNVDINGPQFGTRVGFVVPAGADILLVPPSCGDTRATTQALAVVGFTQLRGVLSGGMAAWQAAGLPVETIRQIDIAGLRCQLDDPAVAVLDVRENSEWLESHIDRAAHIPFHQLARRLDEVPRAAILSIVCGSGQRSSIAASILQSHGFTGLENVDGGMGAWNAAGYPTASAQSAPQPA